MRQFKYLNDFLQGFKVFHTLTETEKYEMLKGLGKLKLLSEDLSTAKLTKSANFNKNIKSYILYLSPANMVFDFMNKKGTLCPMASKGCAAACLNTAGRGRFDSIQNARLRKTLYFFYFKNEFLKHLDREIMKLQKKAYKDGVKLAIRLNGTTDIPWFSYRDSNNLNIFERFKTVQFYDYTKVPKYLKASQNETNWYVTFSASENNDAQVLKALKDGHNVAVVFNEIPDSWKGFKTIDGDGHDLRFLDQRGGLVVALKAKGEAKKDTSGFVKQIETNKKVA